MESRKKLLISGIGGDIAQAAASIVKKEFPEFVVVGCDIHDEHGGGLYVDRYFRSKKAVEADYIDFMAKALAAHEIDYYLPMSEVELRVLAAQSDLETTFPCRVLWAGKKTLNACLDKYETHKFLESIQVETAWTVVAGDRMPVSYPCIFKMRESAGSKNLYICENEADAAYLNKKFGSAGVYQELLRPADKEVTCAVQVDPHGNIYILQMLRRLTGGFTGWAKIIAEPSIDRLCRVIASELQPEGPINIQLILTDNGPRVVEINPRISSTATIRDLLGFKDVANLFRALLGQEFIQRPVREGAIAVRTMGAAVLD